LWFNYAGRNWRETILRPDLLAHPKLVKLFIDALLELQERLSRIISFSKQLIISPMARVLITKKHKVPKWIPKTLK